MGENTPKPGPPRARGEQSDDRTSPLGQRPLAYSKVRSEPYYSQPVTVDMGARGDSAYATKMLLLAEMDRVMAQLDALIVLDESKGTVVQAQ